jgi:multiple sugar transport system permease protein
MEKIVRRCGMGFFILLTLMWLVPFAWIALSAFKTYPETVQLPVRFLPKGLYTGNFTELLGKMQFVRYYKNNITVTLGILIPQVLLSSMAAYGFARLNFRFKNALFMSLFIALMVPLQMILMPRYTMMIAFGWIDSYLGVIIPCIPSVTVTFFIRQQIMGLPKSLDESAIMDGANHWVIYWFIILPLCKSAILATGLMCLVFAWNLFLWPLIVLNKQELYTLSIGTANLQGQNLTKENLLMTAAFLVSIPVIAVFLCTQKHFISGVAMTGIKE